GRAGAMCRRCGAVAVRPLRRARRSRAEAGTMTAMARDFRLPDLGEGLTEAEIVKVLVHEGEDVREDAPLLEVETDKAQVEIPSPMGGRVEKIHVQPGQTVKVGEVLVTFGAAGADDRAAGSSRSAAVSEPPRATVATAARGELPVPATPATRRLARELGVDLRAVAGSGSGGRVTDDDVRAASAGGTRAATSRPAPGAAARTASAASRDSAP